METATTLWFLESFIWHQCEFYELVAGGDGDNILVWAIYGMLHRLLPSRRIRDKMLICGHFLRQGGDK